MSPHTCSGRTFVVSGRKRGVRCARQKPESRVPGGMRGTLSMVQSYEQGEYMEETKGNGSTDPKEAGVRRRDLMKMGAGAGVGLVLGQVLNVEGVEVAVKPVTGELAAATKPAISAASSLSAFPQALTTDGQPTALPPWGSLPNPTTPPKCSRVLGRFQGYGRPGFRNGSL